MKKAIVSHLDILGFRKMIETAEDDKEEKILNSLKKALEEGVNTVNQFGPVEGGAQTVLNFKLFSDNLYVSFSYKDGDITSFSDAFISCISFARTYIINMMDNEIVIRGGISFGYDYSDETIIFSMALVKAYELETKVAKHPRVVIDPELIAKVKEGIETPGPVTPRVLDNSILKDDSGNYFLNPSGMTVDFQVGREQYSPEELNRRFMVRHLKFAKAQFDKQGQTTDEGRKVAEKYRWLCHLFTWLLTGVPAGAFSRLRLLRTTNFQKIK